MDEKTSKCGICGLEDQLTLLESYLNYSLWECKGCLGQFWEPMQNPGQSWYERDERYSFRNKNPLKAIETNHKELLKDAPARKGRLLDIGMGTGNFLAAAVKHGYDGYGIDFDRDAIKAATTIFGLSNVQVADIDQALRQFGQSYFDVVTMFEVLEHLDKPKEFLGKIKTLLKTKGFLALSVPYRGSWNVFKKFDKPPRHLTRWNEEAMRNFLTASDFEIVRMKIIPTSFGYLVTKFHFWTKGFLSFGLVEKISTIKQDKQSMAAASQSKGINWIKYLARFKDYFLFSLPAALLYFYLATRGRHGLNLYVLGRLKS